MLQSRLCLRQIQPVKYHDMSRAALIDQIQQARETLEKLLTLLQSAPLSATNFCPTSINPGESIGEQETAVKSGKQIERCVISTFQIAESMGFKGDFREWEDLLRIGD